MTKTSDISYDELTVDDLQAVNGGSSAINEVIKSIGNAISHSAGTSTPPDVWVGCAWVPQWW